MERKGKIGQVIGPVVDVLFDGEMPPVYEKLIAPATGALIAPIELTAGIKAYFLGKPNPFMMRRAVKRLEVSSRDTLIIGDRMDTDIIAGVESEIDTALVLSGVTSLEDLPKFAYQPKYIFKGLQEMVESLPSA